MTDKIKLLDHPFTMALRHMMPLRFLQKRADMDQIEALHAAAKWTDLATAPTPDFYYAAVILNERQTVLPACISCRWFVLNPDDHAICVLRILDRWDVLGVSGSFDDAPEEDSEDQGDGYPDDDEELYSGGCGEPATRGSYRTV